MNEVWKSSTGIPRQDDLHTSDISTESNSVHAYQSQKLTRAVYLCPAAETVKHHHALDNSKLHITILNLIQESLHPSNSHRIEGTKLSGLNEWWPGSQPFVACAIMLDNELACSLALSINVSCAAITRATDFLLDSCNSPAMSTSSRI